MPTDHFNELTPPENERLAILAEECAEVIQCVTKILRHGYESDFKGKLPETNREALEREMADLTHAMERMYKADDVDWAVVKDRVATGKRTKGTTHHQGDPA